jgi:hypothetical protein
VKAQFLSPADPLVAEDKNRQATTQKSPRRESRHLGHHRRRHLSPNRLRATIPIGAASANIGFNANAALGYWSSRP